MDDKRRALARLSASYGLAVLCGTMLAAPGPAAWVALSGSAGQAGVYFGLFSLSSAMGAFIGARALDRWGRRPALAGAFMLAALAQAAAGMGYARASLPLFALGTAVAAGAVGTVNLARLAAGELFDARERGRAVARVQVTATFGAVLGPFLLVPLVPVGARVGVQPELLLWALGPVVFLVAAWLVLGARALQGPVARATVALSREPIPRAPFVVAFTSLVCAQAAMVTIMGVTGVELRHAGHSATQTALVMALHFVGMFGLSLVVGRLADRLGRTWTIAGGLALVAMGGATVAFAPGTTGLAVGLLLVGLGWSFSYISGSVLLTDILPPARRARVMGGVDFSTALLAALGSFAGGLWYARSGIAGLGLAAAALVALPIVLTLVARAPTGAGKPAT